MKKPYIPDVIPKSDLLQFEKFASGIEEGFGSRPAVLVVDMTKGFVEDRFPLGCSRTGIPAAQNIRKLLDKARSCKVPIFFTRCPTGSGVYAGAWDYKRGRPDPNKFACSMASEEAHEILEELAPRPDEVVITKAKPSAFFGTQLLSMLIYYQVDTLIVTGMVTSGCVRATVVDAFSYNYRVTIPIECVADRSQISHEVSLFDMDQKYADVRPLQDVLAYIDSLVQLG